MDSNAERTIKRTQEQAVASWIDYLKQIRIERLMMVLRNLDKHVFLALDYIEEAKKELSLLLTSNRGGDKGIHGFIAEIFEVNFGNADSAIRGNKPGYEWVNNNGVNDIIKNGVDIQMKFSKSGGHFGLEAVKEHLQKYPDFLKNGGKYQLPKDFYEYVKQVSEMTDQEIGRLAKGDSDGLNYSKAKWIKEFFAKEGITIDDIEPSQLNYKEVQREVAQETIARKEEDIRAVDQENRGEAWPTSAPGRRSPDRSRGWRSTSSAGLATSTAGESPSCCSRSSGTRSSSPLLRASGGRLRPTRWRPWQQPLRRELRLMGIKLTRKALRALRVAGTAALSAAAGTMLAAAH